MVINKKKMLSDIKVLMQIMQVIFIISDGVILIS